MKVTVLAGGVGGAKLAWGLAQLLPPDELIIVGNTGDDFHHLGLTVCPDLDTVMYSLAGMAAPATGWGIRADTFSAMEMLTLYGGPDWFRLGDRDLATHLMRTGLLAAGESLTQVTAHLCRQVGVAHRLLPMTDQPAPTLMDTDEGLLPFQEWFVRRRWEPAVRQVLLPQPPPVASAAVLAAAGEADLIVIAPSNPLVSVAPILHVQPVKEWIQQRARVVVAVSPIIGGQAVKGPAAKMMRELGMEVSPVGVARFYGPELLTGLVVDQADAALVPQVESLGIAGLAAPTLMRCEADRIRLAEQILGWDAIGGLTSR